MNRVLCCAAAVWLLATAAHAERYTWVFERLEPHPGTTDAFPPGINDLGEAAGDSTVGATRIPTVWGTDGVSVEAFVPPRRAFVRAIANDGRLGGFLFSPREPFRVKDGVLETLTSSFGAGTQANATAMNNFGVLVGNSFPLASNQGVGTIWALDGTATSVGTFGGPRSNAQGINDDGYVTGFAEHADGRWEAYLWDPGTQTKQGLGILPRPGYDVSWGSGVNKRLQVVGHSNGGSATFGFDSNDQQAFLWTPRDGIMELPIPGGPAFAGARDLNDEGYVIGTFHPTSQLDGSHPCVWLPDLTFVDLTPLLPAGTVRAFTMSISNTGWIVGAFLDPDTSEVIGFRLRPVRVPADQQIDDLLAKVRGLGLAANREQVLTRLLEAADACVEAERPRAAVAKLRAFGVIVRAWQGRHIDEADARGLRWAARSAIQAIRALGRRR